MFPSISKPSISLVVLSLFAYQLEVAGEACVTGGPPARVDAAQWCCYSVRGKWFQNFEFQGICVFNESNLAQYYGCFDEKWSYDEYVPTCIECDETKVFENLPMNIRSAKSRFFT